MGKLKTYEAYFEALATAYKPIGHTPERRQFASMSQAEVMAGRKKNLDMSRWTMVLMKCEPKMSQNATKQTRLVYVGAFELIRQLTRNELDKVTVQDEAFEMCKELIAKMMLENQAKVLSIGHLREETIDFYQVDELFESGVGYGVEFMFDEGFCRKAAIKAENWS